MDTITQGTAKKVHTFDLSKKQNGYLVELGKDGEKTTSYLTVALPGCFKGYHMHRIRSSNYVCIKGQVDVMLFVKNEGIPGQRIHRLSDAGPDTIHIPPNIPTAIANPSNHEAWIINLPDPPYDPSMVNEQIEFTEAQCWEWLND